MSTDRDPLKHYTTLATEAAGTTDGGPAFPRPCFDNGQTWNDDQSGMSLRDYFAAKCMPLVAAQWARDDAEAWDNGFDRMARIAYEMSDAMLLARAGSTP